MTSTGSAPENPVGRDAQTPALRACPKRLDPPPPADSEEASHDDYRIRPRNPRPSTRRRARRRFVALAVLPTLIGALLAAGGHPAHAQTGDLIIRPTALTVTEGTQATYTVELLAQPAVDVTVTISGHEGTGASLSPSQLVFTRANYADEQTVTVTAAEDQDVVNETVTLTHRAANGGYNGVSRDLEVTIVDLGGIIAFSPLEMFSVTEGASNNYRVRLGARPTGDVTVTISGHEGTDVTLNKTMLTFTTADFNTLQTVTVTAAQDEYGYDDTVTLTHSAANGGYGGVSREYVVTVDDDEEPAGVITGIFPSSVVMNEAKVSLNIWEATPATRLRWRYQAVGDSTWTTGASPKYTNLTGGGDVTSERFTFTSRHTVALTGLTAGTTYEIQFALTGDNRTTTNETPDFLLSSATQQFSTTSQTIEISITDAAAIADEGQGLLFRLARHHAGSYPPGLTVNYRLEVYNYISGGPNKTDGLASTPESTTTATTFFGHRDDIGGLSISTTRDYVCGEQWRARYYVVTLLDGDNYTPKPGGRSGWEDGYTLDVEHRTQNCDWEDIGGL